MKTRFVVLPDERKLLLGIDKNNVFKEGIVYECENVLDIIIFRPLGQSTIRTADELPNHNPNICSTANLPNQIIMNGTHLLTREEWNEYLNEQNNK
jgi:hypothetical protein